MVFSNNYFKLATLLLFILPGLFLGANEPIILSDARVHPETSVKDMVVSQDSIATDIAVNVLKKGGNAADAAVALAYALAVTQPKAGNLGGGGFALYYDAKSAKTYAIDFRECAPASASSKMFVDEKGNAIPEKSRFSLEASGVPGTVAGLAYLNKTFGKLKHADLVADAIGLAKNGFPVSPGLAFDLKQYEKDLTKFKAFKKLFYPEGKALKKGTSLVQPVLAKTLETLQKEGPESFYTGSIAKTFAKYFQDKGGSITAKDLADYKVRVLEAVKGTYRGHEIYSMPPPSSGGVHIIQMLNILENWDIGTLGANSAQTVHLMTEAMKFAYADRSKFLGDPDFAKVPVKGLTSKEYAKTLSQKINPKKATPSSDIAPGRVPGFESPDTTHFSIADKDGNAISFTYTINFSFGSRIIIPDLGFILNNEMDDFSIQPGVPNSYGLIGGKANAVEPGKRPLSSMTPVMVMKNGKPWLISGSPGGSRIINASLQIILNVIDHKMNIAEATMAPRIHHQWLPDVLNVERGFSIDTFNILKGMGQNIQRSKTVGCTETIQIENGVFYGFADPRRIDGKASGN